MFTLGRGALSLSTIVASCVLVVGAPGAGAVSNERPVNASLGASLNTALSDPAPNYLESDVRKAKHRCNLFAESKRFGTLKSRDIEAATGKKYRGGVSLVATYLGGKCHIIVRYGTTLHGPHYRGV